MSDKLRRILMLVLFIVFCVSAIRFGKSFLEYRKGNKIYDTALEFTVTADTPVAPEEEKDALKRTYKDIDFAGLQAVNTDVIGWIQIADTPVDYPLLDAADNQYYLNHTYDRQWSSYGSIFLEPRNNPDLSEKHLVIYGHNMVNASMFGSLLEYKNQAYADSHPEAAQGFRGEGWRRQLQVEIPDDLLAKVPEAKRAGLLGVLSNDPRPTYHDDEARIYGMPFGSQEIKFRVAKDKLIVVDVINF